MIKHLTDIPQSPIKRRKNLFKAFMYEFEEKPINQLNNYKLEQWLSDYRQLNNLSERTMCHVKVQLNHFFKYLENEEVISLSPLSKISFKQNGSPIKPRVFYSSNEVRQILEDVKEMCNIYLHPILFTVAHTGARRMEILKLKRNDIDLELGLIHIRDTKTKEDRSIKMNNNLYRLIEDQLNKASEYIFPAPEGRMFSQQRMTRWIEKFRNKYPRSKHFGLHTLRHSYAYNFLKAGGEMYQLQAILGHKNISMTIDLYGQLKSRDIEPVNLYL
jgi:integrase/recombinase XerD